MAIYFVDFPINSMVIFPCYVNVHQRVLHTQVLAFSVATVVISSFFLHFLGVPLSGFRIHSFGLSFSLSDDQN